MAAEKGTDASEANPLEGQWNGIRTAQRPGTRIYLVRIAVTPSQILGTDSMSISLKTCLSDF